MSHVEQDHRQQVDHSDSTANKTFPYLTIYNRDKRLHIVDADAATCEHLGLHFRMEGFEVAFSLDAAHFAASLSQGCPDVVVLNLQVGEHSGLHLLRQIRALRAGIPVFILSDGEDLQAAVSAMKLGAMDVISKPVNIEALSNSVRDSLRRDVYVGGPLGERGRSVEVRGFSRLTGREREVLQLIADGLSNKEIGRVLGISPRTVEVHRARTMEKLGAKNAADLIRIVLTS